MESTERPTMKMLPGDEVRQIMWRFAERYDVQMAVAGARRTGPRTSPLH